MGSFTMVTEIKTKADFDTQLKNAKDKGLALIVDFTASWCGPCKNISPKVEALAEANKDKIIIVKVDIDNNEETAGAYKITAMPTFIAFKDGAKVEEFKGADEGKLTTMVNKYAKKEEEKKM